MRMTFTALPSQKSPSKWSKQFWTVASFWMNFRCPNTPFCTNGPNFWMLVSLLKRNENSSESAQKMRPFWSLIFLALPVWLSFKSGPICCPVSSKICFGFAVSNFPTCPLFCKIKSNAPTQSVNTFRCSHTCQSQQYKLDHWFRLGIDLNLSTSTGCFFFSFSFWNCSLNFLSFSCGNCQTKMSPYMAHSPRTGMRLNWGYSFTQELCFSLVPWVVHQSRVWKWHVSNKFEYIPLLFVNIFKQCCFHCHRIVSE